MQVTQVKVYLADEGVVRAFADITLDDCLLIHGLKVLRHSGGYAVLMPNRKWRKGGKYTIAFPTTDEARKMVEDTVIAEYKKVTRNPVRQASH